jgi:hypothetical protein
MEYGLAVGSGGSSDAHPGLPAYRVAHLVIDMNGGRVFQRDNTPFKLGNRKAGVLPVQPRRRWGTKLVLVRQATDVVVENGTFQGGHAAPSDATYSARGSWTGVQLGGAHDVTLRNLAIRNVWGDFLSFSQSRDAQTTPVTLVDNRNVLVDHVTMDLSGRQGIVANDVDGVLVQRSSLSRVARVAIDVEPFGADVVHDLTFRNDMLRAGRYGLWNFSVAAGLHASKIALVDNVIATGQLRVQMNAPRKPGVTVVRDGLTITGNVSTDVAHPVREQTMLTVSGWTHVVVRNNTAYGMPRARALRINQSPGAVVGPNRFVRFGFPNVVS